MKADVFSKVEYNVQNLLSEISVAAKEAGRNFNDIKLMAVTKTVPPEIVNTAVKAGISLLGENRVNELLEKYDSYCLDFNNIHFIGHVQSNKAHHIIDRVNLIESIDSLRIAEFINKLAEKREKTMNVFLQVNIGKEETKYGFFEEELEKACIFISKMPNIKVRGLMTIPPIDRYEVFFEAMQKLFVDIKRKKIDNIDIDFLSMGMSSDYKKAILYGSNIVRIGSGIFGIRS